jgi:hypothetical protein
VFNFLSGDLIEERNILFNFFKNGILGDFSVDHLLQLELIQRQDADHLHEARREYLTLSYS